MKKILLGLSLLSGLCLGSCDSLIDNPPLDKIGNGEFWKSETDLEKYMLTFYTVFPTFTNNNGGVFIGPLGADAVNGSDDQIRTTPNSRMDGADPVVTTGGNWNWGNIRSILFFFDNYQSCTAPFERYKHFLGEAYFFKAYLYFNMVKAYGDVPWFESILEMNSPELYKPRDPQTLVVDNILDCLDKAIEYLTPLSESNYGKSQRLSKETALIFKSRVALYEGTWQKYHKGTDFATEDADPNKYFRAAVDAAEELMSGKYSVSIYNTGDPVNDYSNTFNRVDFFPVEEVTLWAGYDKKLLTHHATPYLCGYSTNEVNITYELVSSYLDKNGNVYDYDAVAKELKGNDFLKNIAENCDPRLKQTVWTPGDLCWSNASFGTFYFDKPKLDQTGEFLSCTGFQLKKGNNPYNATAGGTFNELHDQGCVVFRYAEALLNYAEAKCELGEKVDYDRSINLLRRRAGMPDFKIPANLNSMKKLDYGYSISDELYEIRRERRIELACEGFRHDDYRRWRAHKLFQGKRLHGYPVKIDEWTNSISTTINEKGFLDPHAGALPSGFRFNEGRDYLQCIPTNEITLNPALTQNPGW